MNLDNSSLFHVEHTPYFLPCLLAVGFFWLTGVGVRPSVSRETNCPQPVFHVKQRLRSTYEGSLSNLKIQSPLQPIRPRNKHLGRFRRQQSQHQRHIRLIQLRR